MRVRVDAAEHAREQRDAVAEREQAHVEQDVLHAIEEEDDADQEEQVVVAGHHVLGAEVEERHDRRAVDTLHEHRVARRDAVGPGHRGHEPDERRRRDDAKGALHWPGWGSAGGAATAGLYLAWQLEQTS